METAVLADTISDNAAEWLPEGLDCTVVTMLAGAPGGDVSIAWRVSAGNLAVVSDVDAPDVEVELQWKDAVGIVGGQLVPAVAYMQGKLKPSGRMDIVLGLLDASATDRFKAWLADFR